MPKADIAELVLSLVTTREYAVSIVGDLLEENDAGNPLRFWLFVARTAAGQLCRQIAEAPFGMARAVILGTFLELGLLLFWGGAILIVTIAVGADMSKAVFHRDLPDWSSRWLPFLLSNLVVSLTLGRWISQRYPGRQGSAVLSLAAFHAAITLCAGLGCWVFARAGGEAHVYVTVFIPIVAWDANIVRTLFVSAAYLTAYPALLLAGAAAAPAQAETPATH